MFHEGYICKERTAAAVLIDGLNRRGPTEKETACIARNVMHIVWKLLFYVSANDLTHV
jgi:hypothetical protein